MKRSNWLAAGAAAVLVFACAGQREPAQQAIAKLDSALSNIHDSAAKYSPDALHAVETQVATLKQDLAKGDYQGVLAGAPAVSAAVASLKKDAYAKQSVADAAMAHTKQQWRTLSAEVPKLVAGLQSQVDTLSKSGKLPRGVTKASLQSAKEGVASLDSMWTEAANAVANQDDYVSAVAKGQAVKDKATELMQSLGMKPS